MTVILDDILNCIDLSQKMTSFRKCVRGLIVPSMPMMNDAGYLAYMDEEEDGLGKYSKNDIMARLEEHVEMERRQEKGRSKTKPYEDDNEHNGEVMQGKWHGEYAILKSTYMTIEACKRINEINTDDDNDRCDYQMKVEALATIKNPDLIDTEKIGDVHYAQMMKSMNKRGHIRKSVHDLEEMANFVCKCEKELHESEEQKKFGGRNEDTVSGNWRQYMMMHHIVRPLLFNIMMLKLYKNDPTAEHSMLREDLVSRNRDLEILATRHITPEYTVKMISFVRVIKQRIESHHLELPEEVEDLIDNLLQTDLFRDVSTGIDTEFKSMKPGEDVWDPEVLESKNMPNKNIAELLNESDRYENVKMIVQHALKDYTVEDMRKVLNDVQEVVKKLFTKSIKNIHMVPTGQSEDDSLD